jgi:hypothetical protein
MNDTASNNDDGNSDATEGDSDAADGHTKKVYAHYAREMRFICVTHRLIDEPDVRLTEEEVVLGTILADYPQRRWRTEQMYRMKAHAQELVCDTRSQIIRCEGMFAKPQLYAALSHAWAAWCWAQHNGDREYIESFSLLVLGIVFDCLRRLGAMPET